MFSRHLLRSRTGTATSHALFGIRSRTYARAVDSAEGKAFLAKVLSANADEAKRALDVVGAAVVRNATPTTAEFSAFAQRAWGSGLLQSYNFGTSRREGAEAGAFTVNVEPNHLPVDHHTEMSYLDSYPRYIAFYVNKAAEDGGNSVVCDTVAIAKDLSEELYQKVDKLGVKYVRNFSSDNGTDAGYKTWQEVFETKTKEGAEEAARSLDGTLEWFADDSCRLTTRCGGLALHPETGEVCFMNQILAYHGSRMNDWPAYRKVPFVERPLHSLWGDGSEVTIGEITEILTVCDKNAYEVALGDKDAIILDNLKWTHGRVPYNGTRHLSVVMAPKVDRKWAVGTPRGSGSKPRAAGFIGNSRRGIHTTRQLRSSGNSSSDYASQSEKQIRADLAAAYNLTRLYGFDDLVWNHITARIPGTNSFLITPGRVMYDEITPDHLVLESDNVTGNIIHGSVYESRPDVNCVVHTHTDGVLGVSVLKEGILSLTQDSAQFDGQVGYHDWEGMSDDRKEKENLQKNLGPDNCVLMMRNHGACFVGKTIGQAWIRAYYFEKVCKLQLAAMAAVGGDMSRLNFPPMDVMKRATVQIAEDFTAGKNEWDALVRLVERENRSR